MFVRSGSSHGGNTSDSPRCSGGSHRYTGTPTTLAEALAPRPPFDRSAHIGVHPQRQPGLNWIGVVLPVGKITAVRVGSDGTTLALAAPTSSQASDPRSS